jgi:biopolymer transport protein ExbB/TolQ
MAEQPDAVKLNWEQSDFERKCGFRGSRNTGVNMVFAFALGLLMSVLFYAGLYPLLSSYYIATMFYNRGPTQHATVLLAFWTFAFLFIKWRKLAFQRQALALQVAPLDAGFSLTPETAPQVLERLYAVVDNPKHFLLFARIELALANLKNLRRVGDLDEVLRSQAENEENSVESSYTNVKGFIWAIPVLGFIGTVLGLSQAIGAFGVMLGGSTDIAQIKDGLKGVTAGLATAFETTLVALVAALALQILLNALKKREEDFLDDCTEYALRHVVTKLRITDAPDTQSATSPGAAEHQPA